MRYTQLILGLAATMAQAYEHVNINVSLPQNNAPLDLRLAYEVTRLNGSNGASGQLTHSYVPTSCGSNLSVYHTDPDVFPNTGTPETPILLLNHGYPESSYIWRRIAPQMSQRVPVFVPDRSGYGLSTPCTNGTDESTLAGAILEAVNVIYGDNVTVILCGHDRGARAMQRAAVDIDQYPNIHALGVLMADIVPIVAEYASFSNSSHAVNYFHWAFLPRGEFATETIMALGGGNWVTYINNAGSGVNATAKAQFQADEAWEVYANYFNQLSVTNTSVFDYTAGATIDYEKQLADQAAGRKIMIPTHILYSYSNLVEASGFNVPETWSNWVDPSAGLTTQAICCGQGHFIVELSPSETVDQLNAFLDRLGVAPCCGGV